MQDTKGRGKTAVEVEATHAGIDPKYIQRIRLADGEHQVQAVEFVQLVVGESHSPISAQRFEPALRYVEGGRTWITPLSAVTAFSEDG